MSKAMINDNIHISSLGMQQQCKLLQANIDHSAKTELTITVTLKL